MKEKFYYIVRKLKNELALEIQKGVDLRIPAWRDVLGQTIRTETEVLIVERRVENWKFHF